MGLAAWTPAFFMRVHHVPSGELSLWLAAAHSGGGFVGTFFGGWLCTRYYRADGSMLLRVMQLSFLLAPVLGAVTILAHSTLLALTLQIGLSFVISLWQGPYYTSQQELAGVGCRATASAFGFIFFNLIGAGLGPLLIGLVSDRLGGDAESLRMAMAGSLVFCLWGVVHIRLAGRTMAADLAEAAAA
jgi:MFS family permease